MHKLSNFTNHFRFGGTSLPKGLEPLEQAFALQNTVIPNVITQSGITWNIVTQKRPFIKCRCQKQNVPIQNVVVKNKTSLYKTSLTKTKRPYTKRRWQKQNVPIQNVVVKNKLPCCRSGTRLRRLEKWTLLSAKPKGQTTVWVATFEDDTSRRSRSQDRSALSGPEKNTS
jgi:hypothetical protein